MIESDYLKESAKLIKDLREIPTLKPFDENDLKQLLRMCKIRKYEPGEIIIEESQQDSWIYFLVYGSVKVIKKGEEILVMKRRGDLFGEMGVLDGSPRSASVYAGEQAVCLAADARHIEKMSGDNKIVFHYILYRVFAEILADRLRFTTQQLIKAKGKNWKFW